MHDIRTPNTSAANAPLLNSSKCTAEIIFAKSSSSGYRGLPVTILTPYRDQIISIQAPKIEHLGRCRSDQDQALQRLTQHEKVHAPVSTLASQDHWLAASTEVTRYA